MANFCSSSIKRNNRQKSDLIKYILYAEQSSVNDHFHRVGDGAIITIISLLSTAISRREKNALEKRIQRVGCMWKENSVRIKEALPHLWSVMMMPNEIVYGLAKRRCQKIIHGNYMKFHHNEPGHTVGSIAPSFYLLNTKHSMGKKWPTNRNKIKKSFSLLSRWYIGGGELWYDFHAITWKLHTWNRIKVNFIDGFLLMLFTGDCCPISSQQYCGGFSPIRVHTTNHSTQLNVYQTQHLSGNWMLQGNEVEYSLCYDYNQCECYADVWTYGIFRFILCHRIVYLCVRSTWRCI